MRTLTPVVAAALLCACGSPPTPPAVDKEARRLANTAAALELQRCQHDLHDQRLQAAEASWIAQSVAATRERVSALQQTIAALQAPLAPRKAPQDARAGQEAQSGNSIYVMRFGYGSARIEVAPELAAAITQDARAAAMIILRGRTDGQIESAAESAIARARALAVRDYLVAAGIAPSRIRATYQPVGDHVADNHSAGGREMNRRVEIEIYRSLPTVVGTAPAAPARSAHATSRQRGHHDQ